MTVNPAEYSPATFGEMAKPALSGTILLTGSREGPGGTSASESVGAAPALLEVGAACFSAASTLAETDGKSTGGAFGIGKAFVELRFAGALSFLF
jgi:hypothetical protein